MTGHERFLVVSTTVALLLLNVSPINAAIGAVLLGYICLFGLSNPLSALLALSASQVVADPVGIPLSLAQCLFVAWPLHLIFNRAPVDYRPLRVIALWTVPAIMAFKLLDLAKWGASPTVSYFDLAVGIGLMGAWYVGKLGGRWLLGLTCLGLGAMPSVVTFWLYRFGVPTEGIVAAKAAGIEAGVGLGRSDGNLAGVSIAIASTILFAVTASVQARHGTSRQDRWLTIVGSSLVAASIPAVLGTMSRGGVLYFVSGIGTVIALVPKPLSNAVRLCIAAVPIVLLLQWTGGNEIARRYADSMLSLSQVQMEQSMLMSHQGVLEGAVGEVLSSPLVGTTPWTQIAVGGYGYGYLSHNVWLDMGRGAGFPGILWFTLFFIFPIYRLARTWGMSQTMPFLAIFAVFLAVFMGLSLGNYKTFYVLWALTYSASCSKPALESV